MKALKAGCAIAVSAVVATTFATTTTTGCTAASEVREIYMALDGAGSRPRNVFYADTTIIYCDLTFSGRTLDTTVDATIEQIKGEQIIGSGALVSVDRLWGVGESTPGTGISTVSFAWTVMGDGGQTVPYPVGQYKCNISVNGESAGSSTFNITYAGCKDEDPSNCPGPGGDCPLGNAATPDTPCLGYYKTGAQCASLDDLSNNTKCTCDGTSGTWNCP